MGVGGLLMEIVTRPQPRTKPEGSEGNRNVAAIMLAAGRSTRMGGPNKLLAELGGKPLVRIVTEQALASKASRRDRRDRPSGRPRSSKALAGLKVKFVRNPDFAAGLASSVKAGIAAVPERRRRRGGLPRRYAADRRKTDRPADRGLGAGSRPFDRGARQRRQARQSGVVVAPLLQGIDDARRRYRRPPSDRQAHARRWRKSPVEGHGAFLDIDTPEALAAARQTSRQPERVGVKRKAVDRRVGKASVPPCL